MKKELFLPFYLEHLAFVVNVPQLTQSHHDQTQLRNNHKLVLIEWVTLLYEQHEAMARRTTCSIQSDHHVVKARPTAHNIFFESLCGPHEITLQEAYVLWAPGCP